MMIGGVDISQPCPPNVDAVRLTWRACRLVWPKCLLVDAITGASVDPFAVARSSRVDEGLIYQDQDAKHDWEQFGACERTANRMVHILKDAQGLTVVVDDPNHASMKTILDQIQQEINEPLIWMPAQAQAA